MPDDRQAANEGTAAPETAPAPKPESAKTYDMFDAWDAARREIGESGADQAEVKAEPAPETPEAKAEPPTQVAEEPEHIKWAKSVSGHWDSEKGQFHPDRLAKQAFELQKALSARENQLNQINALLQRPEILEAVSKIQQGGQKQAEKPATEEPESDEAVLAKFVKDVAAKEYRPVIDKLENTVRILTQNFTRAKVEQAKSELRAEFGTDETGNPVFDGVFGDIAATIAQQAIQAGIPPDQVVEHLAANDTLTKTMRDVGRQILFPKLSERLKTPPKPAAPTVPAETKRKLAVSPRPSSSARPAETDIKSFEDAVAAAKRELQIATE